MTKSQLSRIVKPGFSLAEVHAHTRCSDGMVTPEKLVAASAAIGIGVLCITDHDTISAVEPAREAGEKYGVVIISGEEITTAPPSKTHIIGLFLEQQVRMGMSIEDTIDAIHDCGGLAIIAHPFMPTYFASMSQSRARRILETRSVDGIELRHTSPMGPNGWRRLDTFYAEHKEQLGAAIGASDTHFGHHDLGRILTSFQGSTASDFRRAIVERTTAPTPGVAPLAPPISMRMAQQWRALYWLTKERMRGRVGDGVGPQHANSTPRAPVQRSSGPGGVEHS